MKYKFLEYFENLQAIGLDKLLIENEITDALILSENNAIQPIVASEKPNQAPLVKESQTPFKSEKISFQEKVVYPISTAQSVESLETMIQNCLNCTLGQSRQHFVFSRGNSSAEILVIGEAPGAEEDRIGKPFVGKAGQLLDKILSAINLSENDVYICNILKCRPPNNRDPQSDEISACFPYLLRQFELLKPKIILCLGRVAANSLLGTELSLKELRESSHRFMNCEVFVTYHPSALLRNENWKRPTWEDVQKFKKRYLEIKES